MSGRKYSEKEKKELSDKILALMSEDGKSCLKACKAVGVPRTTFFDWVEADPSLGERCARARELLEEHGVETAIAISNEPVQYLPNGGIDRASIEDKKFRSDTIKWATERMGPRKNINDDDKHKFEIKIVGGLPE